MDSLNSEDTPCSIVWSIPELCEKILTYLDPVSLANAEFVSTSWYNIIHHRIWKKHMLEKWLLPECSNMYKNDRLTFLGEQMKLELTQVFLYSNYDTKEDEDSDNFVPPECVNLDLLLISIESIDILDLSPYRFNLKGWKVLMGLITKARRPLSISLASLTRRVYPVRGQLSIGDKYVMSMSSALTKIKVLNLECCYIGSNGVKGLVQNIKDTDDVCIDHLTLSLNPICDEGFGCVCTCLGKVQGLEVSYCHITVNGVKLLVKELHACKDPIKTIILSGNKLFDEGALVLDTLSISKIQYLQLEDCHFTSRGVKSLLSEIKKLDNPIKLLNLGSNNIGDNIASDLCECLHNIEALKLHYCKFTADGIRIVCDKIKLLSRPMEVFNVSHNPIEDQGIIHLSECIFNIKQLFVEGCKLTNAGIKTLSDKINLLSSQHLKFITIQNNDLNFSDDEDDCSDGTAIGSSISHCISNIECLNLGMVSKTEGSQQQIQKIVSKINSLPYPRPRLQWCETDRRTQKTVDYSTEGPIYINNNYVFPIP